MSCSPPVSNHGELIVVVTVETLACVRFVEFCCVVGGVSVSAFLPAVIAILASVVSEAGAGVGEFEWCFVVFVLLATMLAEVSFVESVLTVAEGVLVHLVGVCHFVSPVCGWLP